MKLYLHIGTEKTATTTIQHFLDENRDVFPSRGYSLLVSGGIPNNRKFAAYCLADDRYDDFFMDHQIADLEGKKAFQAEFRNDFANEMRGLSSEIHSVIVSSEHLHSRLQTEKEVENLAGLLREFFDEIEIVCYFREQSGLAKSLYSTAVQSGAIVPFSNFLSRCHPGSFYYNYFTVCNKWASVFGAQNITARLFNKDAFVDGDIRKDFLDIVGVSAEGLNFDQRDLNQSLSPAALELGVVVNRAFPRYRSDGTLDKARESLFNVIRSSALARSRNQGRLDTGNLYERFDKSNTLFARRYLKLEGNPFPSPRSENNITEDEPHFEAMVEVFAALLDWAKRQSRIEDRHAESLRDAALTFERQGRLDHAKALMELAQVIRPKGPLINRKLEQYRAKLTSQEAAPAS